jgi:opacity protein-like surface antigen
MFLLCAGSYAQQLYPRLGLTAAVNSYNPAGQDMKPRLGFMIGAGYSIPLTKSITVQPELNFVQKSFSTKYDQNVQIPLDNEFLEFHEIVTQRYRFSYVELPVLLKVSLFHKNFFLAGGPSVALGLGGSYQYELERTSAYLGFEHQRTSGKIRFGSNATNDNDVQCDNRWDIGLQIGIGAVFFKRLLIECRQSFGSVNIYDNVDSKHRYLQLSLSTPISLKR